MYVYEVSLVEHGNRYSGDGIVHVIPSFQNLAMSSKDSDYFETMDSEGTSVFVSANFDVETSNGRDLSRSHLPCQQSFNISLELVKGYDASVVDESEEMKI